MQDAHTIGEEERETDREAEDYRRVVSFHRVSRAAL
jgi:hypothetical protein